MNLTLIYMGLVLGIYVLIKIWGDITQIIRFPAEFLSNLSMQLQIPDTLDNNYSFLIQFLNVWIDKCVYFGAFIIFIMLVKKLRLI